MGPQESKNSLTTPHYIKPAWNKADKAAIDEPKSARILSLVAKLSHPILTKETVLLVGSLIVAISCLVYFQTYSPKVLKEVREVKSYKTTRSDFNLPQMQGTKELGSTQTDKGTQMTLQVKRTPEEIRIFYKNVMADRGWDTVTTASNVDSYVDTYRIDEQTLVVTISKENELGFTVVGLNLTKK
jgi:hypothetical protein